MHTNDTTDRRIARIEKTFADRAAQTRLENEQDAADPKLWSDHRGGLVPMGQLSLTEIQYEIRAHGVSSEDELRALLLARAPQG